MNTFFTLIMIAIHQTQYAQKIKIKLKNNIFIIMIIFYAVFIRVVNTFYITSLMQPHEKLNLIGSYKNLPLFFFATYTSLFKQFLSFS